MVIFASDQSEACGQVRIKDDNNPESPEVFKVTFRPANLVIPRPPDLLSPIAEVTIIDDDCKFYTSSHIHFIGITISLMNMHCCKHVL